MTPKKLLEILAYILPYTESAGSYIHAQHEQIWIYYEGVLPKYICEFLASEGAMFGESDCMLVDPLCEDDGGITYEEYAEEEYYQGCISFYV